MEGEEKILPQAGRIELFVAWWISGATWWITGSAPGIFGAALSWDAIIGHDGFHPGSDVMGALAAAESRTRSSCNGRGVDSGTSVGA